MIPIKSSTADRISFCWPGATNWPGSGLLACGASRRSGGLRDGSLRDNTAARRR